LAAGTPAPAPEELFRELQSKGAVTGSASSPSLTEVGKHVLLELALRAYRTDELTLDAVATEISSTLADLDAVARRAEYFLGEIGPLTPTESLPYMRMAAVGLAHRGASPEELAEEFRNVWGMVDVMEGDGRDRLLAAEMLLRSQVPVSRLYAPIMHTADQLRAGGSSRAPVSTSVVLHLLPAPTPVAPLSEWTRWRRSVGSDEVAALLAGLAPAVGARLDALRGAFKAAGAAPEDALGAAVYLLVASPDPGADLPRAVALAGHLAGRLPAPFVAASLLVARHALSADELADWVQKAVPLVPARRLAPTAPEHAALAVALVHGLDPSRFRGVKRAVPAGGEDDRGGVLALLALHAWVYRPILEPSPSAVAHPAS
jgi:hypothetical protein